jgi:hypothetical protein
VPHPDLRPSPSRTPDEQMVKHQLDASVLRYQHTLITVIFFSFLRYNVQTNKLVGFCIIRYKGIPGPISESNIGCIPPGESGCPGRALIIHSKILSL